ncbi:MAG TPA: tetratricopeptide repeat protein [Burkholderiales bacterium]|nr:tetratricopeptide repeat protein [Burkholderiales bacterium]
MSKAIENLQKLIGTPRDGALLRYSLGLEHMKEGDLDHAVPQLREAVARDPLYSAAWKALGKALEQQGADAGALDAFRSGIEAARRKGDKQAEKEMSVFARRLEKRASPPAV